MPKKKSLSISEHSYRTAGVVALNILLIVQAVILHWDLGTMVWIYYVQGVVIVVMGMMMSKNRFSWVMLLAILAVMGLILTSVTIPSSSTVYTRNGVRISADEAIVFKHVAWGSVLLNAVFLAVAQIINYIKSGINRQQITSFWEVVERLLPLQLTILFAATGAFPVIIFMVLKSVTDVISDLIVRWVFSSQKA
jgi:hypothetical protein